MIIKIEKEREILREGGKRLAKVLETVAKSVRAGVSVKELDEIAHKMIINGGDKPAFLNYQPDGAKFPYPASLCVSINDEVVHGIPTEDRILKNGDIVSLDCGLQHKGIFTDHAITLIVGGRGKKEDMELLEVTRQALQAGIDAAIAGNTTGDIGFAVESVIKPYGFGIVRILAGHGLGYNVHEEPFVPNCGRAGEGVALKEGLVIAIEPMINLGSGAVTLGGDGYTYKTRDGLKSAHFEHTVIVGKGSAEVVTKS